MKIVCELVEEVTNKETSIHNLHAHRTKSTIHIAVANRFICHILHTNYGLPWKKVAKITNMSEGRVRKLVYILPTLIGTDDTYKRVNELCEELF